MIRVSAGRDFVHATMDESEDSDGYHRCNKCGEKTALVFATMVDWRIDDEPFKSGEMVEVPDEPEIDCELTGHYCLKCKEMSALFFNL